MHDQNPEYENKTTTYPKISGTFTSPVAYRCFLTGSSDSTGITGATGANDATGTTGVVKE